MTKSGCACVVFLPINKSICSMPNVAGDLLCGSIASFMQSLI
eukprot:CAMPEP_0174368476 /NCGR_PEP_ID=MMETSP0811_2-20130205/89262_1 /TAXON_ID=73025 ORGANISM="Eutreptiella gymnastica-like, Strain CCMP1594" /NCGR_SAMPLE_ID=MMETSP0811_2 /ASSEMBLY_ACC=CAM_ASM_000667 /LENGTH=41 /DNA_ID= /DNA_START= /DNA_END= /DNA_ORIENTATION=